MRDGPIGTTLRGAEFEKTEGLRGANIVSMSTKGARTGARAPPGASLTAESILGTLAEHRERIRSLGIRRIGLFGSFVRGETTLWNATG